MPNITPLPVPPTRQDPTNFNERADAFLSALESPFVPEINALRLEVLNAQTAANSSSSTASTAASTATAAADAAQFTADALMWDAATSYALGQNAISPTDFQTYRRKVAGTSATDPAADAANWVLLTSVYVDSKVGTAGGLGFRNRLINAQGLINQRAYASGTATTTANQYTLDRWRVVTSGQNLTFSTSANQVTFTAPAGGVEQVIEGLNLESGTYILNWEGTATATVGGVAVAKGGTVTVVGGTNTTVRFIGGTFIRPQFEAGSVATPFERRPFGTELALCQRYYEVCVGGAVTSINTVGGFIGAGVNFRQTKRATPTVVRIADVDVGGVNTPFPEAASVQGFRAAAQVTTSGLAKFQSTYAAVIEL